VTDIFEDEHAGRAELGVGLWNDHTRVIGEQLRKAPGVAGFADVIQLLAKHDRELAQQGLDVSAFADRVVAFQPLCDGRQRGQVGLDDRVDARALHLDHHGAALM